MGLLRGVHDNRRKKGKTYVELICFIFEKCKKNRLEKETRRIVYYSIGI